MYPNQNPSSHWAASVVQNAQNSSQNSTTQNQTVTTGQHQQPLSQNISHSTYSNSYNISHPQTHQSHPSNTPYSQFQQQQYYSQYPQSNYTVSYGQPGVQRTVSYSNQQHTPTTTPYVQYQGYPQTTTTTPSYSQVVSSTTNPQTSNTQTTTNSNSSNSSHDWPPSLTKYTTKAFLHCKSQEDRKIVQKYLKTIIQQAMSSNTIQTINWDSYPLPEFFKLIFFFLTLPFFSPSLLSSF